MYGDIGLFHYRQPSASDSVSLGGVGLLTVDFENSNQHHAKVEGSFDVILPWGLTADRLFGSLTPPGSGPEEPQTDSLSTLVRRELSKAGARVLNLVTMGKAPMLFDMRELYLAAYLPWADVAMGRQIINFGKGFLFSPLDAFSRVEITDIAFRRQGSDVLNIRIPLGMVSGIDIIAEAPFPAREHTSAIKVFGTLRDWDLSGVAMYKHRGEEALLGFGFKGDLVVGLYGEMVGHFQKSIDSRYFETMLGTDYSIDNRWIFTVEYAWYEKPSPFSIWSHHNVFFQGQYVINDLMTLGGNVIHAFDDDRTIATALYTYNILQNVDMSAYVRSYRNLNQFGEVHNLEYAIRTEVGF